MIIISIGLPVQAQTNEEATVLAKWVYALVPYVTWPDNKKNMTLCTVGQGKVPLALQGVITKGGTITPIMVERKSVKSDYSECAILYITASEQSNIENILNLLRGKPVLTVARMEGFTVRGGMVEFRVLRSGQVKLVVNIKPTKESRLKIHGDLLGIAKTVSH